jgi:hypothetical protein
MNYNAIIDGGEGGHTIIKAESAKEALIEAIDWAEQGDWPEDGCDITVYVENMDDDSDCAEENVHINSKAEQLDEDLDGAEEIAERSHEFSTESIVVMEGQAYYRHKNGGDRGSYDRMGGDGVWRESPVEPSRIISKTEARRLLLDWGHEPGQIVEMTRCIE